MSSDNCWFLRWSDSCTTVQGCMMWFLLVLSCAMVVAQGPPERLGCHLIGYSTTFRPPNCQEFNYTGNACYGYCESTAFSTEPERLQQNPLQEITSTSQCCDMDETTDFTVSVPCVDGLKEFTLKWPNSCKCSHCRKDTE